MIQRGRVLSVDTNYEPPLLSVALHVRGGQTVTISNVLTVSQVFNPLSIVGPDLTETQAGALARPRVGQEVLLLCPSGRAADECYAIGLTTTEAALADFLDAPVDGFLDAPLTLRFSVAPDPADRLLTITGAVLRLGYGERVTPTMEIDGEQFRARYTYPLLGSRDSREVVFAGRYSRTIQGNRAVVLEVQLDGDASIPLVSWEYEVAVSDTAPTTGQLIPQAVGGQYPVAALYGRLG